MLLTPECVTLLQVGLAVGFKNYLTNSTNTATLDEPAYSPGEQATTTPFPTRSSGGSSSSNNGPANTAATTGTSSSRSVSTGTTPSSSSPSPSPSGEPTSAPSSGELSRSDQIAIGIGLGVGLPTVLIGILAWFYPRQFFRRGSTAVPAPAPAAAGGIAASRPAQALSEEQPRYGFTQQA